MLYQKLHAAIASMHADDGRGAAVEASERASLRGALIVQVLLAIHWLQENAFATDVDRHLFGGSSTRLPQVHSALQRLVDGGYLQDKHEFVKGPNGGRPKRRYFVTPVGLTEIKLQLNGSKNLQKSRASPPRPRRPLQDAALARLG